MISGPARQRLCALLEPVVGAAGFDLEDVRVVPAGRRRLLRVVVDRDEGVSLDDAAELSRSVSAALDETDAMGAAPYVLEVTSPGVDRPLTIPRHWQRAVGRLVRVALPTGEELTGRVRAADGDGVDLEVGGQTRRFAYAGLGQGHVQVEFTSGQRRGLQADDRGAET